MSPNLPPFHRDERDGLGTGARSFMVHIALLTLQLKQGEDNRGPDIFMAQMRPP